MHASTTSGFTLPRFLAFVGRRLADIVLFGVTATELVLLLRLTPSFSAADWIYVMQHLLVLGIALIRARPKVRDCSIAASLAVAVSYAYPYAQVIYLDWSPGDEVSHTGGLALIILAAAFSLISLLAIGSRFGVRPALRDLVTRGPYRFVRHPIYLSYVVADIGYNLQEWGPVTLLMVAVGWASLMCRIRAEERVISHDAAWPAYTSRVRYRILPGLW
jgi:protein-S-isoprenylcysteine O-methyltransferase Ste14